MSIKLTDTQLVILSAAAQREDRCLILPPTLKGGAAQKVANKLISSGFTKEVRPKAGAPIWRRDEESGEDYALKLTAAGARRSPWPKTRSVSMGMTTAACSRAPTSRPRRYGRES